MIRILQCVNNMHRAGLETLLMNYYRSIDRTKVQFDFLMHRSERSDYDDEIESMGGRIFRAPRLYPQNYPKYFKFMASFFQEHPDYQIVHSHIDAMSYLPLLAAKKAGIPIRIAHSHNTGIDLDFKYPLKQYFRHRLNSVATHCFSCGQEAGEFLFRGREFTVIPNAIETERFQYCGKMRERKRQELGVSDSVVIGHVGRFAYAKNHKFLLEIFDQIQKRKTNTVLLLIGTGEKENQMRQYAAQLGLTDKVRFLGSRSDVQDLYQAMDVFVLPSLFEGIPVVGIEAQYAGLTCVFSNKVPQEVAFTENACFIPLDCGADQWAERVLSCAENSTDRKPVMNPKYDIKQASGLLNTCYRELQEQLKK